MKYFIAILFCLFQLAAFADTLVLSNRPLYDIINQVKTPQLQLHLVAQQSNTHMQEIRPTEIKIVEKADIFLLIKPFDNAIEKIAHNQKKKILIANDLSMHILPLRSHEHHEHHENEEHHESTSHYHEQDPHLWLSPFVVRDIINALQKYNSLWIDEEKYQDFLTHISTLKEKIPSQNSQPYWLVYHDAWQYLENFFDLKEPAVFTQNPESILRPKDFQSAIEANKKQSFHCILIEPTTNQRAVNKIKEVFDGKIILLDPSGKTASEEINSLYWIWDNYINAIHSCLNP